MTPARLQTIEEIFRAALDQEPDRISAFLDTAAKAMSLCAVKLKRSWLHISDRAASLKRQLLVSPPGLFKMGKVICSSVARSVTTKFLNRSAPAGWVTCIWPP